MASSQGQGSATVLCCKAQSALQSLPAKLLACAAAAEYRDWSCHSANRKAEFLAWKSLSATPPALMPNPSLKRNANGLPPGPRGGACHHPPRGPGGKPSSSA